MSASHDELFRLTATEAVALLKHGDITPLDLIDAAERRIAEVEPAINALPTRCLDRAREHARRLTRGEGREAEGEPGWLGGLPVAIKDLADVAGVRTTYGSPLVQQPVRTALRAGADGAHRGRRGALSRCHDRFVPPRSPDLRGAAQVVCRCARQSGGAEAHRLHCEFRRQGARRPRDAGDLRQGGPPLRGAWRGSRG